MPPTLPTLPIQTCLRAASRPATPLPRLATRTLTTTAPTLYKQPRVPGSDLPIPSVTAPQHHIPPYPYGPRQVYHQSNTGLYGSARIRFGNNVSERNQIKTRRKWRPNVHHKRLWSASLGVFVRTRVTARVLRTVDKAGGLDEYLLGRTPQRVRDLGPWGWKLRWRIMQTPAVRARFAAEREALGLPPKEDEELRLEAMQALPDGTAVGEALMAETDKMLAEETEFDLETEGAEGAEGAKDGFMKEEKPSQ
ncbi:ribosomal L28 family-domain-containing protein [Chaetomium sp. MPI-CAGE-AT-0009]|nr:ribosomal L28 family-domain-containing protein [Chaetomium sp. MPI-CAGE-AT-0009]